MLPGPGHLHFLVFGQEYGYRNDDKLLLFGKDMWLRVRQLFISKVHRNDSDPSTSGLLLPVPLQEHKKKRSDATFGGSWTSPKSGQEIQFPLTYCNTDVLRIDRSHDLELELEQLAHGPR